MNLNVFFITICLSTSIQYSISLPTFQSRSVAYHLLGIHKREYERTHLTEPSMFSTLALLKPVSSKLPTARTVILAESFKKPFESPSGFEVTSFATKARNQCEKGLSWDYRSNLLRQKFTSPALRGQSKLAVTRLCCCRVICCTLLPAQHQAHARSCLIVFQDSLTNNYLDFKP